MRKTTKNTVLVSLIVVLVIFFSYSTFSLPAAPVITPLGNTTSSNSGIGTNHTGNIDGGYIQTINLNVFQQNLGWKAYIGNVTGSFILEDADGYSIYAWDMTLNTAGKVFISRNGSIDWPSINCSNQSAIDSEESDLGIIGTDSDSINSTFNYTSHKTFTVAEKIISNSTCRSIATYINGTAQSVNETSDFQEVLLADTNGNGNLVYTAIMEADKLGYRNDSTYDFQAIVADETTASTITNYYFYVELGV